MSDSAKIFILIMIIPFLSAVGHDVYLNYFSDSEKMRQIKSLQIDPDKFIPSDLGWVWHEYAPENMKTARTMVEPEIWKDQVDPILQTPSIIVSMVPAFAGSVFLIIAFVLGVWPFSHYGRRRREKEDDFAVYSHARSNTVKYKKK